jgi:hypothetical protein
MCVGFVVMKHLEGKQVEALRKSLWGVVLHKRNPKGSVLKICTFFKVVLKW